MKIFINQTCPYILATDYCPGNRILNYIVIVDHEHRYSNYKAYYMKTVAVLYNGKVYQIDKKLRVLFYLINLSIRKHLYL